MKNIHKLLLVIMTLFSIQYSFAIGPYCHSECGSASSCDTVCYELEGRDEYIKTTCGQYGTCNAPKGMTFRKRHHDYDTGTDRVGCVNCDPYNGDTSCNTSLSILCLKKDGSPDPDPDVANFYNGWAGGKIKITSRIKGTDLKSINNANRKCGKDYKMAEFHDGNGGWNWRAYGNIPGNNRKYWVHINDQPNGNCF